PLFRSAVARYVERTHTAVPGIPSVMQRKAIEVRAVVRVHGERPAESSLNAMLSVGMPTSDTPYASIPPPLMCASYQVNRSAHGRCGLISSRAFPSAVRDGAMAQALEPRGCGADVGGAGAGGAVGAVGAVRAAGAVPLIEVVGLASPVRASR